MKNGGGAGIKKKNYNFYNKQLKAIKFDCDYMEGVYKIVTDKY